MTAPSHRPLPTSLERRLVAALAPASAVRVGRLLRRALALRDSRCAWERALWFTRGFRATDPAEPGSSSGSESAVGSESAGSESAPVLLTEGASGPVADAAPVDEPSPDGDWSEESGDVGFAVSDPELVSAQATTGGVAPTPATPSATAKDPAQPMYLAPSIANPLVPGRA